MYHVRPSHDILSQRPVFGDLLPHRLNAGLVEMKPDVCSLHVRNAAVTYVDGSVTEHVDTVIYATGYKFNMSFELDEEVELYEKGKVG